MSSINQSPISPRAQGQSSKEPDYETEKLTPDMNQAPDGGGRAWLVAAGASTIFFGCLGFSNSFGAFEEYRLTHQLYDHSPSEIAWIGSLSGFLQFAVEFVGGPCLDRFEAWVIRPDSIAYVVTMMLLSICTVYWHFLLVQGILMGLVMDFLHFPAFGSVAHCFDKKRAAAFGVVVLPIVISKMLNDSSLGFACTVRILVFRRKKSSFFVGSAFKDPKDVLVIVALFFASLGLFSPLFYLPTYAHSCGMSSTLAGYLLGILNAA
ncbi:Hypothetical protein R9X50_00000800 [Acrodontium crateriforme]|uniref:MFS general substrate transporter n=1 Tax=Acrodontium crateriforme TaxID=150365 RepID=A0AAQ3LWD3_9PEZI|nr:Hypothetical protein R9X50_00000800 [Acrodontium crateriforme]